MPKSSQKKLKNPYIVYFHTLLKWLGLAPPKKPLVRRILYGFIALLLLCVGGMYGVARWYIAKHANEPLAIGATFSPDYARSFGLDPQSTMDAAIHDLGIKRFRLLSYWDDGEPSPGHYDFSDLDWEFKKADENGVQISLAIGLRQPRWPECHMPGWAQNQPENVWSQELKTYMGKVIDRYKNNPALISYQLENEYFLSVFGHCTDFSRSRLVDEFNFVRSKDPNRQIIITRSNNAVPSWPIGQPRADENGASIYKRVWDKTVTKRYFEYPIPAWFYAFLGGGEELTTGRNTFIHELQAEAWLPGGSNYKMNDINSIPEQNKSLNAQTLGPRFDYGVATGMRTIDVWGIEWWYWRKEKAHDPSLWNVAKQKIAQYDGSRD